MKSVMLNRRMGRSRFSVFDTLNITALLALMVVTLYPFVNMAAVSLNQAVDTTLGSNFIWPRKFTLYNYKVILKDSIIYHAFMISVLRTVVGTFTSVFCTAMLAYTLSRKEYILRSPISMIFVFTMYFSGGLIPVFMLIKSLGLTNSFWVYIIPGLVSAFNLIIMRSFIDGLPEDLVESAKIDGANDFTVFIRVVLPLCMPAIATVSLFVAVGQWNSWIDTFLYNSANSNLSTLQYELLKKIQSANLSIGGSATSAFLNQQNAQANMVTPVSMRAAITMLATVPILLVYPFLQKYFIKGMTLGGVKE
ncbi:putative aldouronate transport system permease protein [Paenibacillus anaericanus]|uniref:carbohydrate ABC transporter permease n=1 Tax=Paenibacillus anaericanus TaxID=170367 RepID=UPI0027862AE8|nr:carbohydrate ABC transporter permease [Paenibacillus anaericanus]MDQ0091176.1 putative aldouronate transport system permease protein [Paenibacillus anaericanus]